MIKLFVFAHWLELDGVAASLIGLLKALDYTQVSVDLFLMHHRGPWLRELPPQVRLLPPNRQVARYAAPLPALKARRDLPAYFLGQAARLLAACRDRLLHRRPVDPVAWGQLHALLWAPFLPRRLSPESYDLALAFAGEPTFARRVRARKTAAWIHTDWSHYSPLCPLARLAFRRIDHIVNVSPAAKAAFDRRLPALAARSTVLENILSPAWLHARSRAFSLPPFPGLKLLTVARISPQKRPLRALRTAQLLKAHGLSFQWRFVGSGEDEPLLRAALAQTDLADCFLLEGPRDNPMPYYAWCDLYVCTSDWEGKSVSIREAQSLGKPALTTAFPTASSQLEDGADGLIVPSTPEALAQAILSLARDPRRLQALAHTCQSRDYSNRASVATLLAWA